MKLKPNPARLWQAPQVRAFVSQTIDKVGERGWSFLSVEMREAMIGHKVTTVTMGLERGDIPCAAIGCLYRDMLTVAGLLTTEEA